MKWVVSQEILLAKLPRVSSEAATNQNGTTFRINLHKQDGWYSFTHSKSWMSPNILRKESIWLCSKLHRSLPDM